MPKAGKPSRESVPMPGARTIQQHVDRLTVEDVDDGLAPLRVKREDINEHPAYFLEVAAEIESALIITSTNRNDGSGESKHRQFNKTADMVDAGTIHDDIVRLSERLTKPSQFPDEEGGAVLHRRFYEAVKKVDVIAILICLRQVDKLDVTSIKMGTPWFCKYDREERAAGRRPMLVHVINVSNSDEEEAVDLNSDGDGFGAMNTPTSPTTPTGTGILKVKEEGTKEKEEGAAKDNASDSDSDSDDDEWLVSSGTNGVGAVGEADDAGGEDDEDEGRTGSAGDASINLIDRLFPGAEEENDNNTSHDATTTITAKNTCDGNGTSINVGGGLAEATINVTMPNSLDLAAMDSKSPPKMSRKRNFGESKASEDSHCERAAQEKKKKRVDFEDDDKTEFGKAQAEQGGQQIATDSNTCSAESMPAISNSDSKKKSAKELMCLSDPQRLHQRVSISNAATELLSASFEAVAEATGWDKRRSEDILKIALSDLKQTSSLATGAAGLSLDMDKCLSATNKSMVASSNLSVEVALHAVPPPGGGEIESISGVLGGGASS